MRGYKTHKVIPVRLTSTWKINGKKKISMQIEDAKLCTGEILKRPNYWMYENKLIASRWKNVNCKQCLKNKK